MAQAREIKRRIKSVENTKQITRAMKMVAAAKLKRAQDSMFAMRPYAERLESILGYLAVDLIGDEHPFFAKREPKKALTIVIAGDRGLCGGFNTNIIRAAKAHLAGLPDRQHSVITIGKRAGIAMRKGQHNIIKAYYDVFEKLSYVLAGEICDQVVEMFSDKSDNGIDELYIVYNEFVNVIKQNIIVKKLLPVSYEELAEKRKTELEENKDAFRPIYEVEPDIEKAMARLMSRKLATEVYHATLESYAAELAARMTAMDNATNNAEEMIGNLTLIYNRARQAGITTELLDIVGGANALA